MKTYVAALAVTIAGLAMPAAAQPASPAQAQPVQSSLSALQPLDKQLNSSTTALIVVDFQNSFGAEDGEHYKQLQKQFEQTGMLDKSVNLVKQARALGIQVVQVTEAYSQDYRELDHANGGMFHRAQLLRQAWKQGSYNTLLYPAIAPGPEDNDILLPNRMTLSGFGGNGLDYILKAHGIRNVAVTGFTADVCVYATTLAAYDLGYRVYTLSDLQVANDMAATKEMLRANYPMLSRVMTSDDFLHMFPKS